MTFGDRCWPLYLLLFAFLGVWGNARWIGHSLFLHRLLFKISILPCPDLKHYLLLFFHLWRCKLGAAYWEEGLVHVMSRVLFHSSQQHTYNIQHNHGIILQTWQNYIQTWAISFFISHYHFVLFKNYIVISFLLSFVMKTSLFKLQQVIVAWQICDFYLWAYI